MVMAPKAEIPLYHQNRLGGSRALSTRRRRSGAGGSSKSKRNVGGSLCWSVLVVGTLVLLAFGLGTFTGIELAQAPGGPGTSLHNGNHAPRGTFMPKLEHPGGQEQVGGGAGELNNRDKPAPLPPWKAQAGRGDHQVQPPAAPGGGNDGGGGGAGVGLSTVPWLHEHSFHAREGAFVTGGERSLAFDNSEEVTVSAWIHVDREMSDIKTVLGNKMSGCGSDALGFALYVNDWNKKDGQLWLEWGDGALGCHKIHSKKKVPVGQWVHVAARFDSEGDEGGKVSVFMDGNLVASRAGSRRPGSREEFAIGAFSNGDFSFDGRIGAVTFFGAALTDTQIQDLAQRSKDSLIAQAVEQPSLKEHHQNLLVALQLDEAFSAEREKDGAEALHANGTGQLEGGTYHFMHMQEPPKVDENLRDGISAHDVTPQSKEESDRKGRERAAKVKEAMQHAWKGYEQHAWGADELAPRAKKGKQPWGGMGVTLVDSLDTLWLMGMKDEFNRARDWVKNKLTFSHASEVSVFETTIRELGGLLSAYDLSKDEIFKTKAIELADLLLPAFDTNTGIPTARVSFRSHKNSGGTKSVLAEIGTLQVEFRYLSKITGIPKYAEKVNRVFDHMYGLPSKDGLYPIFVNPSNGQTVGSQVTFGALGDSFYEYLLKAWLQGGKTETKYRTMYDRAMDGMTSKLLRKSDPSGLTYVSDLSGSKNVDKMDHLVCFLAGTLALGSQTTDDPVRADRDLKTAKALAYTCYQMYERQKTGLAPEMVTFEKGKDMVVPPKAAYNILRPETAEALYVLHQITGDPIYRDWSWNIFQACVRETLPIARGFRVLP
ncbi:unnamed protein product [Ectocarpus sp. CCAP 1310/34]|nr:unnamed protein product [Ectocarpus sp. CCAP 1310/34]